MDWWSGGVKDWWSDGVVEWWSDLQERKQCRQRDAGTEMWAPKSVDWFDTIQHEDTKQRVITCNNAYPRLVYR